MNEEIVDIIDKNNKVLYQTTKVEAHKKGLLHRTIISEVINNMGQMLLVKQAGHKQDKGQYVSPVGGHIQAGESEENALKREVFEEIGLTGFTFKRIGDMIYDRETLGHRENHFFIIYEIYSDGVPILNDESVHFEWFPIDTLRKEIQENPRKFGDAFYPVLNKFYSYIAEHHK